MAGLYPADPAAQVPRPLVELRGHSRMVLTPGERRTVALRADGLAYWDTMAHRWVTKPDRIRLMVSASYADSRLEVTIPVLAR